MISELFVGSIFHIVPYSQENIVSMVCSSPSDTAVHSYHLGIKG